MTVEEMESEFERVFGEKVGEVKEEAEVEEGVRARARKTEAVPSVKEVEEHNLEHSVCRSWCPHCVKGRAEAYGHRKGDSEEKGVPAVAVDYMHMRSEQEKEGERGMPVMVMKDSRTRMITAKVVPSKGLDSYAVASVSRALEQLGCKKVILRSDNEPAILALKEAVRQSEEGVILK